MQTTIFDFINKFDLNKPMIERNETHSTQEAWVRDNLLKRGFITRNECLSRYISRLAARIDTLKKDGMVIEGENLKTAHGVDFVYYLVDR